jgi:6-phosphogluconolactonase (cycloisomerase 2 family)
LCRAIGERLTAFDFGDSLHYSWRTILTELLLVLAVLPWSQTAPDPSYLQGAVASAQRLEIVFLETDPPTRVVIEDAKVIEQLAQVTNLSLPGVSTVRSPQSGHVFHIRVVAKGQGAPVHEFTLCERRLVFYGSENAYHAQLASDRFHYLLFREVYRNTKEGKEKSERLTFVRAYRLPPGQFHSTGNALAISHDGRVMYIADGGQDALHVFIRGESTGLGSLLPRYQNAEAKSQIPGAKPHPHLTMPVALALSPDDRFLYLGPKFFPAITVLACGAGRNLSDVVQVVEGGRHDIPEMNQPESLAISPDGRHAYVMAAVSRRLLIFARNQEDGTLRYLDSQPLGELPTAVTISPDGKTLYVITHRGCLSSYRRNDIDGRLQPLEEHRDDRVLKFGSSLVVSLDGRNVYTTSLRDGIAVWTRDEKTGKLGFLEWLVNGKDGVSGLDYASAIAVHPAGHRVYVAAQQDSALTAFERQQPGGKLRFLEAIRNGQGRVDGLRGARAVVVSPDGRHVYVGSGESPVVVFSVPGYEPYFEDP